MVKRFFRIIVFILLAAFIGSSVQMPVFAQMAALSTAGPASYGQGILPQPGTMVNLSPAYTPAYLKGIVIHPKEPLKFDFIIYKGDKPLSDAQKREEYTKLTKYFLASLAIPDDEQWVNLSPYEKGRIIKDDFGRTEMGRDLLAQDYMLKQITASLIYPENNLGREFWNKVYAKVQKQYGTTNIPVNTFNKVWILPDSALIYEKGNTAYILKNHLRVMLEEDYLSLQKHSKLEDVTDNNAHSIVSNITKQIVLPELEREVNEGKNFAPLRQVYSGMLLATWFKRTLKQSLLGQVYTNKAKVKGIEYMSSPNASIGDPQYIYQQYLKAYKKGVFNFIKEEAIAVPGMPGKGQGILLRKYFSGGMIGDYTKAATDLGMATIIQERHNLNPAQADDVQRGLWGADVVNESLEVVGSNTAKTDAAMRAVTRRGFIKSFLRILFTYSVIGPAGITVNSLFSKWKYANHSVSEALKDSKSMVLSNFIDRAIRDNMKPSEVNAWLLGFMDSHKDLLDAVNAIISQNDISKVPELTLAQDKIYRQFVAQIVRYAYLYWLNENDITDEATRQISDYLEGHTYLIYGLSESNLGETGENVSFERSANIWINLSSLPDFLSGESLGITKARVAASFFGTASHELMHFIKLLSMPLFDREPIFFRSPLRLAYALWPATFIIDNTQGLLDEPGAASLKESFRIPNHDDITWLGASSFGYSREILMNPDLLGAVPVELLKAKRANPLVMHGWIREIPPSLSTWVEQTQYIEKNYSPQFFDAEPKSSYRQAYRLAFYAYDKYGPGLAADYLINLYWNHHKDMHFAQMELAAGILKEILGQYTLKAPHKVIEDVITWNVLNTMVKTRISYPDLERATKVMVNHLVPILKKSGIIDAAMTNGDLNARLATSPGKHQGPAQKTMRSNNGGIDLNSANLAMTIKRDSDEIPTITQQDLAQFSNIEGFDPVILSIKPASQTAIFSELAAHF